MILTNQLRKPIVLIVVAFLFAFFCPVLALAEGNAPSPQSPVPSNGDTGGNAPNPSATSMYNLDVTPIDPQHAADGFRRMGKDIGTVGEGVLIPLTVVGLIAAGVCLLFGAIFKNQLLLVGFGILGILIVIWLILGDIETAIRFLEGLTSLGRSYW